MFSAIFIQLSNCIQVVLFVEKFIQVKLLLLLDGESSTGLNLKMGSLSLQPPTLPYSDCKGVAECGVEVSPPHCARPEVYSCTENQSALPPPGPGIKPGSPGTPHVLLAGLHSLNLVGLASLPLSNAPCCSVGLLGDE